MVNKTTAKSTAKDKVKKSVAKNPAKVGVVMHEWKEGKLHSGSKKGPVVKKKKQAVSIALNSVRKEGVKIPKKKR